MAYRCINPALFAYPEELKSFVTIDSKSTRFIRREVQINNFITSDRSFLICGPKLWNKLPTALTNELHFARFKRDFKTYLFRSAVNLNA